MSDWRDEEEELPAFPRAELGARLLAGGVDLLAQLMLVTLYFAFPLITGGAALPIWGVFAAVVGYSVVPLALYGATGGMVAFGLRMVSSRGRAPQLVDLLFRELIGRGSFPLAYLGSLVVALVGTLLGVARFTLPAGAGFVLFVLSVALLFAALAGNLLAVVREDGRSLADLVARTVVIPADAAPPPGPLEDEERRREANRKLRALVIAELCMLLVGLGVPWLISRQAPGESTADFADRVRREKLEHQFAQDPANPALAKELAQAWEYSGGFAEEERVWTQHRAALEERHRQREQGLREQVARAPDNDFALWELIQLLEDEGRALDARTVYSDAIEAAPSPERRATFGVWLYQKGLPEPAIEQLTAALDGGLQDAQVLAYRGFAQRELGQHQQARADLEAALALDPALDQVAQALAEAWEE